MAMTSEPLSKMRQRGRKLCQLGWGAFAVSLVLPAAYPWFITIYGWECIRSVFGSVWELLYRRDSQYLSWSGFAVTNLMFLLSPLCVWRYGRNRKRLRQGAIAMAAATLYVASFMVWGDTSLAIGYYMWLLSYALVTAGALHLAVEPSRTSATVVRVSERRTKNHAAANASPTVPSAGEIDAQHELEAYLSGEGFQPVQAEQQVEDQQ